MEATATTPYSALTFACKTCDEHKVLHLLDSHADVNEVDDGKQSPLLCAVEGGHVLKKNAQQIVVKILLRRNADVNIAAEDGRTPIWCACRWGLIDIMRQLVDANADPTQRCAKWGESAIDVAIRYKRVTLLQQIKLSSPDASFRLNQFLRQYSEMELLRKSFLEVRVWFTSNCCVAAFVFTDALVVLTDGLALGPICNTVVVRHRILGFC